MCEGVNLGVGEELALLRGDEGGFPFFGLDSSRETSSSDESLSLRLLDCLLLSFSRFFFFSFSLFFFLDLIALPGFSSFSLPESETSLAFLFFVAKMLDKSVFFVFAAGFVSASLSEDLYKFTFSLGFISSESESEGRVSLLLNSLFFRQRSRGSRHLAVLINSGLSRHT